MTDNLRVIFYQVEKKWFAQGIEHDVCVQADRLDDLYGRFEVAVRLERDDNGSLNHVGRAPEYFEKMWDRKSGDFKPANLASSKYEVGVTA